MPSIHGRDTAFPLDHVKPLSTHPHLGEVWTSSSAVELRDRVEDRGVAEAFELGNQPAGVGLVVAAGQPLRTEVLEGSSRVSIQ